MCLIYIFNNKAFICFFTVAKRRRTRSSSSTLRNLRATGSSSFISTETFYETTRIKHMKTNRLCEHTDFYDIPKTAGYLPRNNGMLSEFSASSYTEIKSDSSLDFSPRISMKRRWHRRRQPVTFVSCRSSTKISLPFAVEERSKKETKRERKKRKREET